MLKRFPGCTEISSCFSSLLQREGNASEGKDTISSMKFTTIMWTLSCLCFFYNKMWDLWLSWKYHYGLSVLQRSKENYVTRLCMKCITGIVLSFFYKSMVKCITGIVMLTMVLQTKGKTICDNVNDCHVKITHTISVCFSRSKARLSWQIGF